MNDLSRFANHYWFKYKRAGACSELRGRVCIQVVFVSSPNAPWSERSQNDFWKIAFDAREILLSQARHYGVPLEIDFRGLVMNVPAGQEHNFVPYLPSFFHRPTLAQAQDYYKDYYSCDEAPIIFVINADGRSYAQNDKRGDMWDYDEMSVLRRPFCPGLFMHELLHQYGAQDYYFPAWLTNLAAQYAPTSVMLSGSYHDIDEVSAYLIGWTSRLSARSQWFLEQTLCITEESHRRALEEEWKKKVY